VEPQLEEVRGGGGGGGSAVGPTGCSGEMVGGNSGRDLRVYDKEGRGGGSEAGKTWAYY